MRKLTVAIALVVLTGCANKPNPEKMAIRETLWQGSRQIRENEKKWAEKLVAYPVGTIDPRTGQPSDGKNRASEIVPLTPAQFENGKKAHKDLEDAYKEDVARDTGGSNVTN